jgi:hypothetical protein
MNLKRKLFLIIPFLMGVFTMLCAILSKHLSFTQPFSAKWVFWYCRKSSTAMIVTNMPYSWALIRRAFGLNSFFRGSDDIIVHNEPIHQASVEIPARYLNTSIRAGSVAMPLASYSTTAALDRLYPVDDTVPELIEEREKKRGRGDRNV